MIHLDTSFLIRALVSGSPEDLTLRGWLLQGAELGMSAIAWAELLCGPVEPAHVEGAAMLVGERVPFGGIEAAAAAELFHRSGRRRGSFADCMIAATALASRASLATGNPADFRHFEAVGLEVIAAQPD